MIPLEGGAFGPFEADEEDQERIARAERNRLRRKGLNPKGVLNKPKKTKTDNPQTPPHQRSRASPRQTENPRRKRSKVTILMQERPREGLNERLVYPYPYYTHYFGLRVLHEKHCTFLLEWRFLFE